MATATDASMEKPISTEHLFDSVGPAYEDAFEGHPEQLASSNGCYRSLSRQAPSLHVSLTLGAALVSLSV
jgi:hypothetical protein